MLILMFGDPIRLSRVTNVPEILRPLTISLKNLLEIIQLLASCILRVEMMV